jgi:hypothetical protein
MKMQRNRTWRDDDGNDENATQASLRQQQDVAAQQVRMRTRANNTLTMQ